MTDHKTAMTAMELQDVELGRVYKNTKTQRLYQLTELGLHTETDEIMARYVPVEYRASLLSREGEVALRNGEIYYTPLTRFAGKRVNGRWYFELVEDLKVVPVP